MKLDYDIFQDLVETNSKAAAGIWKWIVKRVTQDMIDQKRLSDFQSFAGIQEEDIYIENKFSIKQEKKWIMSLIEGGDKNPHK